MTPSVSKNKLPLRIRAAGIKDVADIEALEAASFEWAPEDAFSRRQITGLLHNPRAIVRVAASKGKVLGWCAGLLRHQGKLRSGRIYAIAVHPDAQGLRLGRRLMERMLAELRSRGAGRIYLEVDQANKPAIALYEKLGFEQDRHIRHYYGRGRHALHFRRGK